MIVIEGSDHRDAIKRYVETQLGALISEPCTVFGYVSDDKRPLCAVIVNDYNGSNVELTLVAEPGGLTRGVLRHAAGYAFNKLACRRITVRSKKRNKRALKTAERLGFTYEHVAKHYFPDDDAVVYRLLRQDCKWF